MIFFRSIHRKLDEIVGLLKSLAKGTATMDAATAAALTSLTDKVTALTTVDAGLGAVIDAAAQIINGIPAQIAAALANAPAGTDPALVAALTSLGDSVGASGADLASKKDELSAAVVANTPAAPVAVVATAPAADSTAAPASTVTTST